MKSKEQKDALHVLADMLYLQSKVSEKLHKLKLV